MNTEQNCKRKNELISSRRSGRWGGVLVALLLLGVTLPTARAANYFLEGLHKYNMTFWDAGNLRDWEELDYTPCRVRITGGPVASQTIILSFPHLTGTTPGWENLYDFVASPNMVFLSPPTLSAPTNADWSYRFTINVTDSSTATINFFSRMAAGAHNNPGSSLQISADPQSTGQLQVHKPAPRPGYPDLAIKKTGPMLVPQGAFFTYTLAYTNKATDPTNFATGVQISDILPPEITVQTNSLGANAHFAGNTIFWDLTNVAPQATGQISFQVRVNPAVPAGAVIQNYSQILSGEDDVNYADNTSIWSTTVTGPCVTPTLTCLGNKSIQCGSAWTFDTPIPSSTTESNAILVLSTVTNAACGNTFSATRTWQATNVCGTTETCAQTVTVVDTAAPVIVCAANKIVATGAAWTFDDPTATDACGTTTVTVLSTTTNLVGACTNTFNATCTWRASDGCGNSSQCSQTVKVADRTPPQLTCPTNLTVQAVDGLCSSIVTFVVGATDNCNVLTLVSIPASGSMFPVGVTTVTNTTTDASGNQSSCFFTVTVTDQQNPVITCPSNLVFAADPGQCSRSNVVFTVGASDNCSVTNLVSSPPSGSSFPVGVTTVTNTATDASGNTASCSFTVTVNDTQGATIICSSNLVLEADPGQCSRSNVTFAVSVTDNCSVTNVEYSTHSGSTFPVGTTTVTNTVTDASGNQSSCSFTVTVTDHQNPVINCSSNLVFEADPGKCSRGNVSFFVSATDNCTVTNLVSTMVNGGTFPVGVTTVTNTATDASGNTTTCSFTVTVTDQQSPAISCPRNLTLTANPGQCSRSNVSFNVSAWDNCGEPNLVSIPPSGSTFPLGVTTVLSTATDASGNERSCSFTVTVTDTESPGITCSSNLVLTADPDRCSRSHVAFAFSATDNCSVTNLVSSSLSGGTFAVGVTTITNTATDASGNKSSCSFTVTVTDAQSPAITCSSNLVLTADAGQCSRSNVSFTVSATDNCGVTTLGSSPPSGSTFPVGVTTVTSTATDANGNQSSCNFTVTVTDTESPVIICSSNLVLTASAGRCHRTNVVFALGATDNCAVTNLVSSPPAGSTFPLGVTPVTCTATDASGNQSTCSFTVTVTDDQIPTMICPANLVLPADAGLCSRSNVTFIVRALDNCSVTNLVSSPPSGSTFPLGETTVTTTATDASGNQSSCSFRVTVTDTQISAITCSSNLLFAADPGQCSRSNVTFFVSATDNCSVTNLWSSRASGSTFPVGVTTVTNTATDVSGNTTSCSFTVTVTDHQYPVITCPSNLVLSADPGQCGRSNVTFQVSASDNCGVASLVSTPPSGSTFPVGLTTVTSWVTDPSGNESQCHYTVTVLDQQAPAITCPPDFTVNTAPGANGVTNLALGDPVTTDNCAVVSVTNNAPAILPVGTNFVLWTATDASGNSNSCSQRVVVVRTCSGIIDARSLAALTVCQYQPAHFAATAISPDPVAYRWSFNGHPMAGQTNDSLELPFVDESRAGIYTVEARTECATNTRSATLTVRPTPTASPTAYTNLNLITIQDVGKAVPYFSELTPQCVPGLVKKLTVHVFGYFHGFPSDVSMVLAGPEGRQVKLMAGAGGDRTHALAGVDLTFSDDAAEPLPQYDRIVSGTYRPTDYLTNLFLPPPADGPYSNNLATFIGLEPNHPWKLYVYDASALDGGGIASWSLDLGWRDEILFLQNPTVLTNGQFRAEVVGQTGIPTIIERSSNLVTWQPLATNVYHVIPGIFHDPAPPTRHYYYRARQP